MTAYHVPFSADNFTQAEILYVTANFNDFPNKLMPHYQRNGHRFFSPLIPFVYVKIGPAYACATNLDQYIRGPCFWLRDLFKPKAGSVFFFY